MKGMTFGMLPSKHEFNTAYRQLVGDDTYKIRLNTNDRQMADLVGIDLDGDWTSDQLWSKLEKLAGCWSNVDPGYEWAGDFASGILLKLSGDREYYKIGTLIA